MADLLPDGGLLPEAGGGDGQPGEKKQPVGSESLPEPTVPLALQGDDDSSGGGGGEGGPGDAAAGSRQAQNQGVEKGFSTQSGGKGGAQQPRQGGELIGGQQECELKVEQGQPGRSVWAWARAGRKR